MKRLSPTSSCSSSSSSSCAGSDDHLHINNPDHHHHNHNHNHPSLKPKIKRARKIQNTKEKCNSPNSNTSGRRSSIYRGVTRHRWTGRFEAHLWDKTSWNNIQNKKGRQVYLGAYDCEEAAARTYDLAALKYWGPETTLNFPIETYKKEIEEMQKVSKEEYLASLRRRSSGFSRGVSKYRGVARHHHNGRWEARIGRVFGNKYLYLGTYNTQEEAAAAYDMAAIEYRGANAVTNFDISHYMDRLKKKGIIPLDKHQDSTEQSEETEAEAEVEQPQPPEQQPTPAQPPELPQQQVKEQEEMVSPRQLEYTRLPPCMDDTTACTMVVMDPAEDHEFSWSFCLDNPGLTPFPVPDLPLDNAGELPDLFDDRGFVDNIDFMFDTIATVSASNENEDTTTTTTTTSISNTSRECVLDSTSTSCGVEEVGVPGNMEASPSSSTTTSVSCNY